jgi:hypothetical protein
VGRKGDCRTCQHRDAATIDRSRAEGATFAALARDYGLPETSVRRHFKLCRRAAVAPVADLPPVAEVELPDAEVPEGTAEASSLAELEKFHGPALRLYQEATSGENPDGRLAAALLPQLRANIKLAREIAAESPPERSEVERLVSHPDFAETARVHAAVVNGPVLVPPCPAGSGWADGYRAGWGALRSAVMEVLEGMVER